MMRKSMLLLLALMLCSGAAMAQHLYLDFTSQTEAKFFFYLNGKLLNQKSTGHIRIPNLGEEKYHLRIVVDDPYAVTLTKTMRPSAKKCEYSLNFNPVRDRIFLRRVHLSSDQVRRNAEGGSANAEQRLQEDRHAKAPELREEWKR